MATEGERIASVEQQIIDLRGDIADRKHEEERTRERLHKVEGAMQRLVDIQTDARKQEATQYRRLELRMQALTLVVAFAAMLEPVAYHFATH